MPCPISVSRIPGLELSIAAVSLAYARVRWLPRTIKVAALSQLLQTEHPVRASRTPRLAVRRDLVCGKSSVSRTLAVVIPSPPHPPGRTMVERSQFFAWFLRSPLQRFRRLAGARETRAHSPSAVVVGAAIPGIWAGRTGFGSDGRGAFPFPLFLADRAGWSDRLIPRLGFLSCPSVSLGLSDTDDPLPAIVFKDHVPVAVVSLESSHCRIAMAGRAGPARR